MVIERDIHKEQTIGGPNTGTESSSIAPGPASPAMLRYLSMMFACVALLYAAPFFLVRSTIYDSVNPSVYARPLNYAFTTAGENADVVILGDSAALLGVDPSQMSSALGVKVINLASTHPSLVVTDDMVLRHYLASNRPPKVIVFYFVAWDFDYGHLDFNVGPTYEGQELLLRQGTSKEIIAFVQKHPEEAVSFPLKFYDTAIELTLHRISHKTQKAQLSATHGHMDNPILSPLAEPCTFPPFALDNIRFDWVHSLAARYATPETKVLIYAAPVPSCTNVDSVLSRHYDELPAAPPVEVPARFFSTETLYVHPLPFAVPQLTGNLTDAVRPMLSATAGSSTR